MSEQDRSSDSGLKIVGTPKTSTIVGDDFHFMRINDTYYLDVAHFEPESMLKGIQGESTTVQIESKTHIVINKESFERFLNRVEDFKSKLVSSGIIEGDTK